MSVVSASPSSKKIFNALSTVPTSCLVSVAIISVVSDKCKAMAHCLFTFQKAVELQRFQVHLHQDIAVQYPVFQAFQQDNGVLFKKILFQFQKIILPVFCHKFLHFRIKFCIKNRATIKPAKGTLPPCRFIIALTLCDRNMKLLRIIYRFTKTVRLLRLVSFFLHNAVICIHQHFLCWR